MAKAKIRITLDQEQARRLSTHAEQVGMDVPAYLLDAAARLMAEADAMEARFARVDALIAEAEGEGRLPEVTDADLTEQERLDVQEAMALVRGAERANRSC
jgi:hypothetical protein